MKLNRRHFIQRTAVAGAALATLRLGTRSAYAVAANSGNLRKWLAPLRGLRMPDGTTGDPSGIPVLSAATDPFYTNTLLYQVTVGEFLDKLHPDLPNPTRLWGYWDTTNPVPRHLGGVIIATRGIASRIRFTNTLPATHIIPVDTTIPGANQAQNRIATHLHGGFIPWLSDGGPFDWWTPGGLGYATGESFPNGPGSLFDNIAGSPMVAGQADYFYPNDQSTRLMWYHDHAYGITRVNAYAGIATGYLLLDPGYDAVKLYSNKVPSLGSTLPLVFQDKIFVSSTTAVTDPSWFNVARKDCQVQGSLFYEHVYDPKQFKLLRGGGYLPPPDPSVIPEFFGDTMLCNGTVYPYLEVEPKSYRFLLLNACNARFLNLNLFRANPKNVDGIDLDPKLLFPLNPPGPNMIQIGNEAGYLIKETTFVSPKPFSPITLTGNLLLAPAERADIIIDFTGQAGNEFILYNDAPAPFPVGPTANDYFLGNPNNPVQPITIQNKILGLKWSTGPDTRQVLRIKVNKPLTTAEPRPVSPILTNADVDPTSLVDYTPATVAPVPPLGLKGGVTVDMTRNLTLNEDFDTNGRLRQRLGTTAPNAVGGFGMDYIELPVTETPAAGSVEVWNIFNLTADTHPIHFHLVNVQVLSRQAFKLSQGMFTAVGLARGPELNELGWKETVQMHPGEVTTVVMKFDLPAVPWTWTPDKLSRRTGGHEYVWHCHILEHEEHDMMRPLVVT